MRWLCVYVFACRAQAWYLGMLGLAFVVAIFFRYGLFGLLEHIGGFDSCGVRNSCVDVLAVFRVSFVMACFFAVHALCFLPCIDAVGRFALALRSIGSLFSLSFPLPLILSSFSVPGGCTSTASLSNSWPNKASSKFSSSKYSSSKIFQMKVVCFRLNEPVYLVLGCFRTF